MMSDKPGSRVFTLVLQSEHAFGWSRCLSAIVACNQALRNLTGCATNGIAAVSPLAEDPLRLPESWRLRTGLAAAPARRETEPIFTLLPLQRGQDIQFHQASAAGAAW